MSYLILESLTKRIPYRKALGAGFRRSESPSFDDEGSSIETVVLDPELELVAQRIRAQAKFPDRQSSAVPEEEKVILNVKWKHHPLTTDVPGAIMSFRLDRVGLLLSAFALLFTCLCSMTISAIYLRLWLRKSLCSLKV